MSDNEFLDDMRQTLSGVHMNRPVERIISRGRGRRRLRTLSGVAGGGLALLVGAALALPALTGATGAHGTQGGSVSAPIKPAAFTVVQLPDTSVRLTLLRPDLTQVGALEQKLAEVNVPAFIRYIPGCNVNGPTTDAMPGVVTAKTADDSGNWPLVYTINPSAIPAGAHLIFTVYTGYSGVPQDKYPVPNNVYVAPAGTTVDCHR
jgi:hypothetical protein